MTRKKILERVVLTGALVFGVALTMILPEESSGQPITLPTMTGLEDPNTFVPAGNPLRKDKVDLGRLLFFDKRLSKNGTIACASCHLKDKGFTDGKPVSTGINGLKGGRSAPASINRVYSTAQFWDGRAETLEEQSIGPFINPVEHGFATHDEMVEKMNQIPGYVTLFQNVFGGEITIRRVGQAVASFQRTILSGNSAVDKFDVGGDESALSISAKRGLKLFRGKARCIRCHSGFNFTDEKFHNLGIGFDKTPVDRGRFMVTNNADDTGAFKTPTLREIARTAPYMHDGRFKTLEEVVRFYNRGGLRNPHQDNLIIRLGLTNEERKNLVAMLKSLNGQGWGHVTPPSPGEFPQ